ncbi:MAG: zinc dependent phospholipase C family protein [Bacteroidia bacterium]
MKKQKNLLNKLLIAVVLGLTPFLLAWGIFGHEHINRAAVMALPEPVQTFFYNHIDFVTQESTVPDLRKYTLHDKAENPRHYIDLENFGGLDSLPLNMTDAKKKYDDKFLQQNGILPWYLLDQMEQLTKAFKEKRKTEILFLAGDIGHYIGDMHMPLHTSANHNGQMTDQKGIHAFWETQLPEKFGKDYNYHTAEAVFIPDLKKEIWRILAASHKLKDTLLLADKKLRAQMGEDKVWKKNASGETVKNKFNEPVHSDEYAKAYHDALKGMVEKQLKLAIEATSSFWYTAWVDAGKPDLSELDPPALTQRNKKQLEEEKKLWEKGKLFGIESEKEF